MGERGEFLLNREKDEFADSTLTPAQRRLHKNHMHKTCQKLDLNSRDAMCLAGIWEMVARELREGEKA